MISDDVNNSLIIDTVGALEETNELVSFSSLTSVVEMEVDFDTLSLSSVEILDASVATVVVEIGLLVIISVSVSTVEVKHIVLVIIE